MGNVNTVMVQKEKRVANLYNLVSMKPPTIKEVESELVKKIPEILGLETTPDGAPNHLLIRDEDDEVVEAIDFSDEVVQLKQFFKEKIEGLLRGLVMEVQSTEHLCPFNDLPQRCNCWAEASKLINSRISDILGEKV